MAKHVFVRLHPTKRYVVHTVRRETVGCFYHSVQPSLGPVYTRPVERQGKRTVAYPGIFFGGGSTNSAEDRGQREGGSGGTSPLVRRFTQFVIE
jgi:hypothetical protein